MEREKNEVSYGDTHSSGCNSSLLFPSSDVSFSLFLLPLYLSSPVGMSLRYLEEQWCSTWTMTWTSIERVITSVIVDVMREREREREKWWSEGVKQKQKQKRNSSRMSLSLSFKLLLSYRCWCWHHLRFLSFFENAIATSFQWFQGRNGWEERERKKEKQRKEGKHFTRKFLLGLTFFHSFFVVIG